MALKFILTLSLCALLCCVVSGLSREELLQKLIDAATGDSEGDDGDTSEATEVNEPTGDGEPDIITETDITETDILKEAQLMKQMERIENKMVIIKTIISQEASVDSALDRLDAKLKIDFQMIKRKVDLKDTKMKQKVNVQLDDVKSTLTSVDNYARSRNKDVAGAIYHDGIGSLCETGVSDCRRVQNSNCRDGICQCDMGLSYDALQQRCVEKCRFYGDTFQITPNYILVGYNLEVLNDTSLEECKTACRESEDCVSLEFFPRWQKCYLSDEIGLNETAVEYNRAGSYFQRDCAYY